MTMCHYALEEPGKVAQVTPTSVLKLRECNYKINRYLVKWVTNEGR